MLTIEFKSELPEHARSRQSDNTITACLVIHNEETVIRRCLESMKGIVDEILVVHDGPCEDRSLEICREYGCTIQVRRHIGIGEAHRPWLIEMASSEWILQIDPDEYLCTKAQSSLRELVQSKRADCYAFIWPIWNGTRYTTKRWPYKKVLYRKHAAQYLGFPHEEVRVTGKIEYSTLRLEHKPNYNNFSIATFRTKWNRWIDVHARALLSDSDSFDRFPDHIRLKPHYYFIADRPLLSCIPVFFYHLTGTIVLGGLKEGYQVLKVGLYTSAYYFVLCLRVHRLKQMSRK